MGQNFEKALQGQLAKHFSEEDPAFPILLWSYGALYHRHDRFQQWKDI